MTVHGHTREGKPVQLIPSFMKRVPRVRRSPRDKIAEGRTIIYPIIIQTLHVDVEFLNRRVAGKWRVALGNPWLWHTCHLG